MKEGAVIYRSQGELHYGLVLMKNVKIMSPQRLDDSVIDTIFFIYIYCCCFSQLRNRAYSREREQQLLP